MSIDPTRLNGATLTYTADDIDGDFDIIPVASSANSYQIAKTSPNALAEAIGTASFDAALAAASTSTALAATDLLAGQTAAGANFKITTANVSKSLGARRTVYNVMDYGATGDGNTDDTAAIQAAIDAACGADNDFSAGVVFFPVPATRYRIRGTLHVRTDGVALIGAAGAYGVEIRFDPDSSVWTTPSSEGSQKVLLNFQKSLNFFTGSTSVTGTCTTGGSTTVLTDSGASLSSIPAHSTILNTTTKAWGQVISSTATTVTSTPLTGGTSSQWTAGDTYRIGSPPLFRFGAVHNLYLTAVGNTTDDKLALRLFDVGEMDIRNVKVKNWSGVNSTGCRIHGRQLSQFKNCWFSACLPLRISKVAEPLRNGTNSYDYINFTNCDFDCEGSAPTSGSIPHTAVLIDGDAQLFRSNWRDINYRGGDYATYWNCTTTAQGQSYCLSWENCHWEQVAAGAVANWYLNFDSSALQTATWTNCSFRTYDGSGGLVTGIHAKTVHNLVLINPRHTLNGTGANSGTAAVTDNGPLVSVVSGVRSLEWRGANIGVGSYITNSQADLDKVQEFRNDGYALPHTATYSQDSVVGVTATTKTLTAANSGQTFTNVGSVNNTTYTLPAAAAGLEFTFVRTNTVWIRLEPDGSDIIAGGGAGKYLEMQTDGSVVHLKAFRAGRWVLMSATGTIAYEP